MRNFQISKLLFGGFGGFYRSILMLLICEVHRVKNPRWVLVTFCPVKSNSAVGTNPDKS